MRWTRVLAVATVACFLGAALLYTADVYVSIDGNGGVGDGSFCGSAYDVVFLKKDGYMGGEIPPNQEQIDAACIDKSRKLVAGAVAAGVAGLGALVGLGVTRIRRRSVVGRGDGPVHIPFR